MNENELHLIVLWPKAREKQSEIIADISENLQILECIEVEWTPEKSTNNYKRFYGFSDKASERKAKVCGLGNILVITVMDNNPDYRLVESMRGFEYLNYNMFKLKLKYRNWFNDLHVVHTTNNPNEVKHDICMLLGISSKDYLQSTTNKIYDGSIRYIKRNLAGCDGYKSFEDMFYVLNETVNYAVLRNHEMLPEAFKTDLHGDIDILCEDFNKICNVLNAEIKDSTRVYNIVGGSKIPYDIRYLGDDYYCYDFEKDMLLTKFINDKGITVLADEYYFYSLIYHALYQKKYVSVDYYDKAYKLFCKLGLDKIFNIKDYISPFDLYFKLLKDFMNLHNYSFSSLKNTVSYNDAILRVEEKARQLKKHYRFKTVKSCNIDIKAPQNYKFFETYWENEHLFIKAGDYDESYKNEFDIMKTLYESNNINFIKPFFYRNDGHNQNIVMEYIEGDSLETLIKNNKLSDVQKKGIVKDLENIAKSLFENKIVNRNITLKNLIFANNGHLKLIDFKYAISTDNDRMYKLYDFYLISEILKILQEKNEYIEKNAIKFLSSISQKKLLSMKTQVSSDKLVCLPKKPVKFTQNIFSIRNEIYSNNRGLRKKYKVLRILGFKIKF